MSISKKAPVGARVLDLGALRAARAEVLADQPKPVIKLNAGYVEIKHEFDVFIVQDLEDGNLRSALTRLLADPADAAVLLAEGITEPDLDVIMKFAAGKKLGESSASSEL